MRTKIIAVVVAVLALAVLPTANGPGAAASGQKVLPENHEVKHVIIMVAADGPGECHCGPYPEERHRRTAPAVRNARRDRVSTDVLGKEHCHRLSRRRVGMGLRREVRQRRDLRARRWSSEQPEPARACESRGLGNWPGEHADDYERIAGGVRRPCHVPRLRERNRPSVRCRSRGPTSSSEEARRSSTGPSRTPSPASVPSTTFRRRSSPATRT